MNTHGSPHPAAKLAAELRKLSWLPQTTPPKVEEARKRLTIGHISALMLTHTFVPSPGHTVARVSEALRVSAAQR
jgi:hypothetical protein